MNYLQKTTLRNLVVAAMLVAVGHSLYWFGLTTLSTRSTTAVQVMLLSAYEWTPAQSMMVQMTYQMDVWYFGALADTYLAWATVSLIVVAGLYRFMSARLAAVVAVGVLVGTVNFGVPIHITGSVWAMVTGHEAPYPSAKKDIELGETVAEATKEEVPSGLPDASGNDMPFDMVSFGFVAVPAIYNVVRLALGPIIAFSILVVLLGSVRRQRMA